MNPATIDLHVHLDWSRVEPVQQALRKAADMAAQGRDMGGPPEVTEIFREIGEELKVIGAGIVDAVQIEQIRQQGTA